MLQIANLSELTREDIPRLRTKIEPILEKRRELKERYNRFANQSSIFYSVNDEKTKLSFEQFITIVASGYFGGKAPVYSVKDTFDEDKKRLLKELLGKDVADKDYKKSMEIMIDYIKSYNDDADEHYKLTNDCLKLTSCYEILYENENNEIVYGNYDPLQTVACWDYEVPANLTGIIRKWDEKDLNDSQVTMIELTDKYGSRLFECRNNYNEIIERDKKNHNWGDVPACVYESDFAIYETVVDIIKAFEQIVQNNRNNNQYNDEAKLGISGYSPENPTFDIIEDNDGNRKYVENEARKKEDEMILKAKTMYFGENGKAEWILKSIDDTNVQNTIKTYLELLTMLSCVPNITDTGFTRAENNAAIKNKYFALNQRLMSMTSGFKKMYQRRWELIFGRVNLKKNTHFDFRDIDIKLQVNLPTNESDEIDNVLKKKDVLSTQTIIEELGYDYLNEKNRIDTQDDEEMQKSIENTKLFRNEEESPVKSVEQKPDNEAPKEV